MIVRVPAVTRNSKALTLGWQKGMGRLGLCTALVLEQAGYDVLGADVLQGYVDDINNKTLASKEPKVVDMLHKATRLRATTSIDDVVAHSDLLMVLVATPTGVGRDQMYDCGTLSRVLSELNDKKVANKHVVICCTVTPGYIDNIGTHLLRDCVNTTLSYNPEFIAQGDVINGLLEPDMVLIGEGSTEAGDILQDVYETSTRNTPRICRMSPASAEITKLSINCFITTKISFANYVGDVADKTPNADKFKILQAVGADSRIGGKYLLPGFGYGGPCFPRDNRALGQYASLLGVPPIISEATDDFNLAHADIIAQRMLASLPAGAPKSFVMSDVAYKSRCPVDIIEESHPLEVAKRLVKAGAQVTIKDRRGIVELVRRTYGSMFTYVVDVSTEDGPANVNWGNPLGSYRR